MEYNNLEDENKNEDDSSEEDNIYKEAWKINLLEEQKFWDFLFTKNLIYKPDICPTCGIGSLELKTSNDNNILNPYYYRCNFNKCRKKFTVRNFSIFKLFPKWPASIIYKLIEKFILEGLNAKELAKFILKTYDKKMLDSRVSKALYKIRMIIAEHMKKNIKKH